MQHASLNVKRKSLDLLATQLSQMVVKGDGGPQNNPAHNTVGAMDPKLWLDLIPSLLWFLQVEGGGRKEVAGVSKGEGGRGKVVTGDSKSSESRDASSGVNSIPPQTMQAALLCLKLLARVFGRSHPKAFVPVVKRVTLLLAIDFESVVRSSIFLTLAELCCCLKAQTVPLLNRVSLLGVTYLIEI